MMEAVLLLATIAGRYRLTIEPGQTLELLPSVTLRPRHGLRMRIKAQHHVADRSPHSKLEPAAGAITPGSLQGWLGGQSWRDALWTRMIPFNNLSARPAFTYLGVVPGNLTAGGARGLTTDGIVPVGVVAAGAVPRTGGVSGAGAVPGTGAVPGLKWHHREPCCSGPCTWSGYRQES